MGKYVMRLSWPSRPLWQNFRAHWAVLARAKRSARNEAFWMAREAAVATDPAATLEFQFHPPDARKRDLHNMPATQKAAIDGIAQAMGCDDEGFRCIWPTAFSEPVKGGCVIITIKTKGKDDDKETTNSTGNTDGD